MAISNLNNSIKGLEINKLKEINVPKGNVLKFLDKRDKSFKEFGECYLSCIKFNAIKGWKRHKKATLNLIVPVGKIKFVIFGKNNKSKSIFNHFILSRENYFRLTIPPMFWVAFQGLSETESVLINLIDIVHDPNEAENKCIDTFKYDWSLIK